LTRLEQEPERGAQKDFQRLKRTYGPHSLRARTLTQLSDGATFGRGRGPGFSDSCRPPKCSSVLVMTRAESVKRSVFSGLKTLLSVTVHPHTPANEERRGQTGISRTTRRFLVPRRWSHLSLDVQDNGRPKPRARNHRALGRCGCSREAARANARRLFGRRRLWAQERGASTVVPPALLPLGKWLQRRILSRHGRRGAQHPAHAPDGQRRDPRQRRGRRNGSNARRQRRAGALLRAPHADLIRFDFSAHATVCAARARACRG